MTYPDIIGLTGLKRHGKNAVAKILVEEHGFVERSLAGPLKEMALRINPLVGYDSGIFHDDPVYLDRALRRCGGDEDLAKEKYPEYRRFLQRLGTEGLRYVDDEFWIDRFEESLAGARKVVITDVRFPNEADAIRDQAFWASSPFKRAEVWQVDAGARVEPSGDTHSSEEWVGKMREDLVIDNSGSLEDLRDAVRRRMGGR